MTTHFIITIIISWLFIDNKAKKDKLGLTWISWPPSLCNMANVLLIDYQTTKYSHSFYPSLPNN